MKVCIVGAGRVGLPLALALESKGVDVDIVDFDANVLKAFDIKKMPFHEPKCQDLLNISNIRAFYPNDIGLCDTAYDYFIITVGTPLAQHIETDLSAVKSVIKWLVEKKLIHTNTSIILRSTVAPYTTQYVKNMLLSYNIHCTVAMCPERLAEGAAIEEIFTLPQIVGVDSDEDFNKIHKLFSILNIKILKMPYIEAELSKLFCNIYRYINFAIPNYFMYLADHFGVKDIFGLFASIKDDYPRMKNLASPGFTAGTCLRKDFGMINEYFPQTDLLLQAYKINEFMPKFIVDSAKEENIRGKNILVLGYTFKQDTDDTRDSLVPKLLQYIDRYNPATVIVHDPNLPYGKFTDKFNKIEFDNISYEQLSNTLFDTCFIGTNHSVFKTIEYDLVFAGSKHIIDIWNCTENNKFKGK